MKKLATTVVTGVTMAALASSTAFAWTYGLSGNGACQPDGSYKITWSVDNSSENQPLHLTYTSDKNVIPKTDIAAKSVKTYNQTVDGTKAGSYSMTLKGNWYGDHNIQTRSANVKLDTPCEQPGKGGDTPVPPTTTTTTTPTPTTTTSAPVVAAPAVVPVGAVNAGDGGASSSLNLAAIGAMVASVGAVIVGVLRRVAYKG